MVASEKKCSFAIIYDHISLQNSTLSRKAGGNSAHGHGMIIDKVSVPAGLQPGSELSIALILKYL